MIMSYHSKTVILFVCIVLLACSQFKRQANSRGIESISLTLAGKLSDGTDHFYEFACYSSGKVELNWKDTLNGSVTKELHRTGSMSAEGYEKLVDAVYANDFFSKPDVSPEQSKAYITVVSNKGKKIVDQRMTGDPGIQAIATAISGVKVTWNDGGR